MIWDQRLHRQRRSHFLSNGVPNRVRLGDQRHQLAERAGTDQLLRHRHLAINRLTLNVGARFDRYRVWLPAQAIPVGAVQPGRRALRGECRRRRVQPHRAAPRRHLRPHRRRQDRAEGQLGPLLLQPRRQPRRRGQSRTPAEQYADYNWNDLNGDRVFQEGEETTLITALRRHGERARSIRTSKNSYTDEASVFVERAVLQRPRRARRLRLQEGQQRLAAVQRRCGRSSAFNVPVTRPDPGPDDVVGNGDDGAGAATCSTSTTPTRGSTAR